MPVLLGHDQDRLIDSVQEMFRAEAAFFRKS